MNYQIQGLSIHAEVHGTAEPALVFLHYWGGTSRTWRKVTAELEGQFKTVAYDARGWGKSDKTLAGYKLADLADEALSLVKVLGIKQYVLVGHSMGGKVAQLAASRRPEGLSGLILVAPAQPTPRRNPEEMRQGQLHAYDNRENVLKVIGSGLPTAHPSSPEILDQIVEDSLSGSREATMGGADSLGEELYFWGGGVSPGIQCLAVRNSGAARCDVCETRCRAVLPTGHGSSTKIRLRLGARSRGSRSETPCLSRLEPGRVLCAEGSRFREADKGLHREHDLDELAERCSGNTRVTGGSTLPQKS